MEHQCECGVLHKAERVLSLVKEAKQEYDKLSANEQEFVDSKMQELE